MAIVSDIETYTDVAKHEKNALVAKDSKEWLSLIDRLITDKKLRTDLGKCAFDFVTKNCHHGQKNITLWTKCFY